MQPLQAPCDALADPRGGVVEVDFLDPSDLRHEEVVATGLGGVEEGIANEEFRGAVVRGGVDGGYAEVEGAADQCADGERGGVRIHLRVVGATAEDYWGEESGELGAGSGGG